MPFDASSFDPVPERPEKAPRGRDGGAVIVLIVGFLVLLLPFSLSSCVDLVRYLRSP